MYILVATRRQTNCDFRQCQSNVNLHQIWTKYCHVFQCVVLLVLLQVWLISVQFSFKYFSLVVVCVGVMATSFFPVRVYKCFSNFPKLSKHFITGGDLSWYTHHPTTALYMFSFVQRLSILMYLVLDNLIVSPHDPRLWREQNNRSTALLSMYMTSVDQSWFGSWRKNTTKIHSIVLLLVSTPEVCCRRHHTEH